LVLVLVVVLSLGHSNHHVGHWEHGTSNCYPRKVTLNRRGRYHKIQGPRVLPVVRPSTVDFLSLRVARDAKVAADIVNVTVKRLIELFVEGANILDLCVEGDKFIEEGTGAVYNKSVKGVKVSKGSSCAILSFSLENPLPHPV